LELGAKLNVTGAGLRLDWLAATCLYGADWISQVRTDPTVQIEAFFWAPEHRTIIVSSRCIA
jgi:hypothetical protein